MTHFTPDDQQNIINYLTNKKNYTPVFNSFKKLIRGVLQSPRFHNLNDKRTVEMELQTHLFENIEKWNVEKGAAYSYFTTAIHNFVYKNYSYTEKSYAEQRTIYLYDNKQTVNQDKNKNKNSVFFNNYLQEERDEDSEDFEQTEKKKQLQQIYSVVANLDHYERIIYNLYFVDGMQLKEIDKMLNASTNWAFTVIKKIRIKIRKELGITTPLHRMTFKTKKRD